MAIPANELVLPSLRRAAEMLQPSSGMNKKVLSLMHQLAAATPDIPTGIDRQVLIEANRRHIIELLNVDLKDWSDWRWQLTHRIEQASLLKDILNLTPAEVQQLDSHSGTSWSITPYYLSLMTPDPLCPIRLQSIPSTESSDSTVPTSPISRRLTERRRQDDGLFVVRVSNQCPMKCQYCHFCKRPQMQLQAQKASEASTSVASQDLLRKCVESVAEHQANDVLLTGGDPLLLDDPSLDWLLTQLYNLPHVESITIETRVIATLPQRITAELTEVLTRHKVSMITHVNSPLEVTLDLVAACHQLSEAGISLTNFPILIPGVNDRKFLLKRLNDALRTLGFSPHRKRRKQTKVC